ncbi:hypothetical protein JJD41_08105 [Oxynema sp. CENA135]|uniref:hypothetical protein n=1 Tax=Oxynema sp. CENA135 TaxID=984206 RepID=UPI00190D7E31|nr:hypothetical protein [Oxynema sp. CENA135]MBK4729826.1 hypothetical protein [Oxynema sp. CENA135]
MSRRFRNPHPIARFVQTLARSLLYLFGELAIYLTILAITALLVAWGLSVKIALGIGITLSGLVAIVSVWAYRQHRLATGRSRGDRGAPSLQGDVKFADWIAQTLARKAPREWEEYQDWLHDILFARRQMLDEGDRPWQVTALTYGRLIALCVTVARLKLRRWAVHLQRR